MEKYIEYNGIKSISSSCDVKKYNHNDLLKLCSDLREEIIAQTSSNGGHLSSNLGIVELTVALHRSFDFPKDKLIFDVGHQSYAHKILTGRDLSTLFRTPGISGLQNMDESEYDCYEAGHAGTALSAAQGFALSRDLKGEKHEVIAVVGDASIVTGLSFEALNNIGSRQNKVIIVLNDNDMAISKPAGGIGKFFRKISSAKAYVNFKSRTNRFFNKSKIGSFFYKIGHKIKNGVKKSLVPTTMFDNMGYTYIGPIDGHDVKALEKAFKRAKNPNKSVVIHVLTQKGKGYGPAENDNTGYWHGVTPFSIETGKPINLHEGMVSWSHYFGDLVLDNLKKYDNVELICPAMIKGSGLDDCFSSFPSRCIDVGIAEEHALTLGGAMSLNGIHPIVVIYSTFLQRAYDEIIHDCARMNTDMTILIDRAGLIGTNGETHQGIYDAAFLKTIPNVTVSMPSDLAESKALMDLSMEKGRGVFAIRYSRELFPIGEIEKTTKLTYGKWLVEGDIKENGVALMGVGALGKEVSIMASSKGIDFVYINPLFINPIDEEILNELLCQKKIVIYDPYSTKEGLTQSVLSFLATNKFKGETIIRCVPTEFIPYGSTEKQLADLGLSPEEIIKDLM